MYNILTAQEKETIRSRLGKIKTAEATTIKELNDIVPQVCESVIAGDNIAIVNNTLEALHKSRRKLVFLFFKAHIPFEADNDNLSFIKKLRKEKQVDAKVENYQSFKQSGQTVFSWIDLNTKQESKDPDYLLRVQNAVKSALKHNVSGDAVISAVLREGGFSSDQVMQMLEKMNAQVDAEIPFEPEAAAA